MPIRGEVDDRRWSRPGEQNVAEHVAVHDLGGKVDRGAAYRQLVEGPGAMSAPDIPVVSGILTPGESVCPGIDVVPVVQIRRLRHASQCLTEQERGLDDL